MALNITNITLASTLDPPDTIGSAYNVLYSGAVATVNARFGSFLTAIQNTGSPPSGSVGIDSFSGPITADLAALNANGVGGSSGAAIEDGVTQDGCNIAALPMGPDPDSTNWLSQTGPFSFDFSLPEYRNIVADHVGTFSAPYGYWQGTPNLYLSRTTIGGASCWVQSIGYSSWVWDFGDGHTSTAANPSHTYAYAGSFSATFTASYYGLTVPGGNPGGYDGSSTTISVDAFIFIPGAGAGWHVGRIGMGA